MVKAGARAVLFYEWGCMILCNVYKMRIRGAGWFCRDHGREQFAQEVWKEVGKAASAC